MSTKTLANSHFPIILFCLLAAQFFTVSVANEHGKRLFDYLMLNYNRLRRPADADGRLGPITVRLRLRLSQIIDLHEIDQIMTCSVWLRQAWADPRLAWKPDEYGGIDTLYVPHELIWVPDLILYNNADNNHFNVTIGTKATLHHTGEVLWEPPALFKSQCQINVQWFPFDEQLCKLKFGSWSYSEDILRLQFWDDPAGNRVEMEQGVDLSDYYPSVEWDIMSVRAKRHSRSYPGRSDAPAGSQQKRRPGSGQFTDIVYNLVLRRKPLFYTVNLVFPCLGISFLTILVFYLPSESGEKVALCISILVALTVFFLLLTEVLPATSVVLPLIGKYLLFTMFLVTLSVLITVISLNLHFRKSSTHLPLPRWLRRVFLRWLPKLLFMRRPRDAQAQLLEQEMRLKKAAAHRGGEEHEMGSEQQEAAERRRKSPNKTVAHLQERLQFDCLGPIRVLRDTPLDAMCRPPLDPRWKELLRLPNTVKAFEHICFIAELLKRKDRDLKVDQDWKYVANVLDRLFLVIFALGCFLGTAWILLQAPIFYDRRQPIDLMQFHPAAEDQLQNGRGLAGL